MFSSRPIKNRSQLSSDSSPRVLPWVKMMGLVIILLIISTNNIPQLFADQIAGRAGINASQQLKKYRIINLDTVPTKNITIMPQTKKSVISKKTILSKKLSEEILDDVPLTYSGTGQCIWNMADMQWTGLQINTGMYFTGGLNSGSSYPLVGWTGQWSGFDRATNMLGYNTGVLIHQQILDSGHYIAMRNCVRSGGVITRPGEKQYLKGISQMDGGIDELPILFSGVYINQIKSETEVDNNTKKSVTLSSLNNKWGGGTSQITDHKNIIKTLPTSSAKEFTDQIKFNTIKLLRQSVKRPHDSGGYNKAEFTQSIVYDSASQKLQAYIEADTVMFTAQGQNLNTEGMVLHEIINNSEINNTTTDNILTIEFGTPGEHLIFTKPVQIKVASTLAEGTLIDIGVKHAGDKNYNKQGLTTDPMSTCDLEGNSSIQSSQTIVQSGQIVFYTCGASSFALGYVPGLPSPSGSVTAIREQPDGKILIGGTFISVGGITRNRIARLNADKSLDLTFDPNLNNSVNDIKLQDDGKILIGGTFTTIGGVTGNRIARLNADGTLDTSFDPNVNSTISDIEIQDDGKILIGGSFSTVGGTSRGRIARLNADGTLDTSFNPNANNTVIDITIQSDSNILLGGSFTTIGGVARNRIARLNADGTLDTSFDPNTNNTVNDIKIQGDGQILLGGVFTTVGGVTRNRIARLNIDGTLDTSLDLNINSTVNAIAILSDGQILIGGLFTTIGGVTRSRIARVSSTGAVDPLFNPNANTTVSKIMVLSSGKIAIGGSFSSISGVGQRYFAYYDDIVFDTTYNIRPNSSVNVLATQSDGKIVIGGAFTTIGGTSRGRIARLNADGTIDTSFNPNANGTINTESLMLQSDGKIIIGGAFTGVGGVARNRIARLNADGSLDTSFDPNANNLIQGISIQLDGKVLIGGNFTTIGGVARNRIARLNADGSLDISFDPNANNIINVIATQSDGKIIIGGTFTTVGGVARNRIARLNTDGTLDTSFNPNANNLIQGISIQLDGKVLIGGSFTTIGGVTRNRIARLNADGSLDTSFDPNADNIVHRMYVLPNGDIIIGGQFTTIGGISSTRLAKIDTNGTIDSTFNPNINNTVYALTQDQYNNIYFGGAFTSVNGNVNNSYLAMIGTNEVINNMRLWLKADSLKSLVDGDNVSRWKNLGSRSDATQSTIINRPLFKLKTVDNLIDNINYNPVVQFNGTDNFMVMNGGLLENSILGDAYVYVVSTGIPKQQALVYEITADTYSCPGFSVHIPRDDNNVYRNPGDCSDSLVKTNRGGANNKPYLWSFGKSTTSTPQNVKGDIRRNGSTIITSNTTNSIIGNNSDLYIGSSGPTANYFAGNIAEIIVYFGTGGTINKIQQNKIESYLSIKYGITLDQSTGGQNYILNNGLVSWSTGSAGIYNHDIAGIVRDDASGLAQTKSQSINNTGDIMVEKGVSLNNNTSLIRANNNGTTGMRSTIELATGLVSNVRIAREWKLQQKNGSVGIVTLTYPLASSTLPVGQAYMLVDSDGDFSNGGAVEITGSLVGGEWIFTTSFKDNDIITFGIKTITGIVSIESPGLLSLSGTLMSTGNTWEYQFDNFKVSDTKSSNSGYYTTLSITSLTKIGGATLSNTNIEWKGSSISLLSGSSNPRVVVSTGMQNYTSASTTKTFIMRDPAENSRITGTYGSQLSLKVNIPSYQSIGLYTGTITYTLYEN